MPLSGNIKTFMFRKIGEKNNFIMGINLIKFRLGLQYMKTENPPTFSVFFFQLFYSDILKLSIIKFFSLKSLEGKSLSFKNGK